MGTAAQATTREIEPAVMAREIQALASDLRALAGPLEEQVRALLSPPAWASIDEVYLVGSGDSHHAACAAEMAFEEIGGVACAAMSSQRFLEYGGARMRRRSPQRALVIATSASGGTPRVIQAVERAREGGAATIALTCTADSAVTRAADRAVVATLPEKERSPGIRTYQASLLGMLLVAIRLSEARGAADAGALRQEIVALADAVDATRRAVEGRCREAAERVADAPAMVMLGSGPSHGTARFGAAKMVEATGLLTVGEDVEEWWHVERFAYPVDMPLFVIAPPGRAHRRASEIAEAARGLGRRVFAVVHEADTEVSRHAILTLPVAGEAREAFSPLLYHLFAGYVASHVAERLGRLPFQKKR
ncbi:put. Sugar isomerase domain containing protein [Sorangium cellulosum So ce56]|uniref:Glutamine--fructose-6-phosphate aminotransferase [isomerizing] n=1 Tax=Sorangium cellulosum (strain So ce56) TaxID=448385 RepID=A9FN26_SORC5|nr:SIS domain-containing protein [Sorangium cellulosum]CAN98385.1 put. Sugar isomerase domain containing protein [Sorangium cellulosum So ce56]